MVSDRESNILELQLNNDMLTARLADSASQVGQDPSEQVRATYSSFLYTIVCYCKHHKPGMLIAFILNPAQ